MFIVAEPKADPSQAAGERCARHPADPKGAPQPLPATAGLPLQREFIGSDNSFFLRDLSYLFQNFFLFIYFFFFEGLYFQEKFIGLIFYFFEGLHFQEKIYWKTLILKRRTTIVV